MDISGLDRYGTNEHLPILAVSTEELGDSIRDRPTLS